MLRALQGRPRCWSATITSGASTLRFVGRIGRGLQVLDLDKVRSLAIGGERIKAIQLLRSLTGCSLEQAMAYVDTLALGNEPRPLSGEDDDDLQTPSERFADI
jgi:hypothetical protein